MTVIAVDVRGKEIVIGADSQVTSGWHMRVDDPPKLFTGPTGVTIAVTGYAEAGALLRLYVENNRPRESTEYSITEFVTDFRKWANSKANDPSLDMSFFMVFDGKAFAVRDYYITEITGFAAMGAGMEYAEAALYLGQSVRKAIQAACHLSTACNEPIRIERLPKKGTN